MKMYKFLADKLIMWTPDKILADFMNKRLTWKQRIYLFFHNHN